MPTIAGGWLDLESGVLHRRGSDEGESRKRQPPAKIHAKLLPHLRRWRKADLAIGISYVAHFRGRAVQRLHRSWGNVAKAAGHDSKDGPHILRHSAATALMQSGVDPFEAAGYLGMSLETLMQVYGHHNPSFQSNAAKADGRRRAQDTPKKPAAKGVKERPTAASKR